MLTGCYVTLAAGSWQSLTHIHQPHIIPAPPYLRRCGLVVPPRYCVTEPFTGAVISQKPAGEGHAPQAHHGTNHVPHQRRSYLQHQTHRVRATHTVQSSCSDGTSVWTTFITFITFSHRSFSNINICTSGKKKQTSAPVKKKQNICTSEKKTKHLHQCSLCGPRCWFCAVLKFSCRILQSVMNVTEVSTQRKSLTWSRKHSGTTRLISEPNTCSSFGAKSKIIE